jgi:hypothetical protein
MPFAIEFSIVAGAVFRLPERDLTFRYLRTIGAQQQVYTDIRAKFALISMVPRRQGEREDKRRANAQFHLWGAGAGLSEG